MFWVCVILAFTCLSTSAAEKLIMTLPSGHSVVGECYDQGIVRIKVRPSQEMYEVGDVVIVEPQDDSQMKVECQSPGSCFITNGNSKMLVAFEEDNSVLTEFRVNDKLVARAKMPVGRERTEATFTFPEAKRLYGIPEHATDLPLKHDWKYRLWNLDVFQFKLDVGDSIYGAIPFILAHSTSQSTGILFLNSADTNVVPKVGEGVETAIEWSSETGIHDVFFFPGSTPMEVQMQHGYITGPTFFPPQFSLGYHQCRWNYRSTEDALSVDSGFETHDIPYDVLWLDIEHTDGKKYFTWDLHNFPKPIELVEKIASKGRKVVTITDPHIKREGGYHVHDEATSNGYYVKTEQGTDFEGHCWPGTSSWVDFYNKNARDWYATLFKYDRYKDSNKDVYTWIDMNEPSVFNAHEVTMDRNAVHKSAEGKQVKHRDLHNMYGYYHTMAAYQGHLLRNADKPLRPFILTRSFFAGSQRYAAMWTGDNKAEWSHLEKSIPMLLALSMSNFPFVGADVGGFFFNPSEELLVRWYQAGAFYPFFRAHAHLETKRREPWLFGDQNTALIRDAIVLRYSLIPYLYTQFYIAHKSASNIIRPLFAEFPTDETVLDNQKSYMFGSSLLVRPIVEEGVKNIDVQFPRGVLFYDFYTGNKQEETLNIPVTMATMPLFIRSGHIVPTRQRVRRSTAAMANDPLTLYVAVAPQGHAFGELFMDDGLSFDYQNGAMIYKSFSFSDNKLRSISAMGTPKTGFSTPVKIERIVLFGISEPNGVYFQYDEAPDQYLEAQNVIPNVKQSVEYSVEGSKIVIRNPGMFVAADWTLTIQKK